MGLYRACWTHHSLQSAGSLEQKHLPHVLMSHQGNNLLPTEIDQKDCTEPHKTLGVMKSPDPSQKGERLRLKKKQDTHAAPLMPLQRIGSATSRVWGALSEPPASINHSSKSRARRLAPSLQPAAAIATSLKPLSLHLAPTVFPNMCIHTFPKANSASISSSNMPFTRPKLASKSESTLHGHSSKRHLGSDLLQRDTNPSCQASRATRTGRGHPLHCDQTPRHVHTLSHCRPTTPQPVTHTH
jgi:hypothetical protein